MSSDGAPRAKEIWEAAPTARHDNGRCAAAASELWRIASAVRTELAKDRPGAVPGRSDRGAEGPGGELGDIRRRAPHLHPLRLERLGLGRGGASRARHDRARVAHRLA